eukprot:scaffold17634_cov35-Prasinocladus_malaysianus.AAC.1
MANTCDHSGSHKTGKLAIAARPNMPFIGVELLSGRQAGGQQQRQTNYGFHHTHCYIKGKHINIRKYETPIHASFELQVNV